MNDSVTQEDLMAPTKAVGLRLAPDVVDWLKKRAAADQRSLAFIVMQIVRAEMAREAKKAKR
jgi:hypothetical protein